MASVVLDRVNKRYPNGHHAVREVSIEIRSGEFLVLVGPSGCGKSTLLRLIAGLEAPTSGRIAIDGRDVTGDPPQDRDLAMVFQSYALYPHKSVYENLAFGLRVRGVAAAEIDTRVRAAAGILHIEPLLDRRPAQLSGGQRQRVALGRAIVREPKAFLLDEPLSNLDPLLRTNTRAELALLQRRVGATMVYVTHDQEEALTLGHRIAVMRDGVVEQLAEPAELFERPRTLFVGQFVGAPAMNVWPAQVSVTPAGLRLASADFAIEVASDRAGIGVDGGATAAMPGEVVVGIRPHDIEIAGAPAGLDGAPGTSAGAGDIAGRVDVFESLGAFAVAHVRTEGRPDELVRVLIPSATSAVAVGDRVRLRLRRDRLHVFDAASGRRLP